MGAGNCLFCAGKREIPCAGTGFHWPKTVEMGMGLRFEIDNQ